MQRRTIEDYLKAILVIYESQKDKSKGIQSVEIARALMIKKPSVSAIVKKLSLLGYVKVQHYSPIYFTKKGIEEARRAVHKHRVIEYFLNKVLHRSIKSIHDEAHRLEHAFSDSTIRKLDSFLGNPRISPYGKRIH
ncbi:metal-dependent transcriptional regulator [Candidatus Pacearchaeota archaeon]|nr:metal-dependent transcriptional regulator [Candidatus Pacearchaeota archaeon]